ncbi:uncharacterized protein LOC134684586 [Mytilus trossulus]|uniref:uncharacterized protein LOC134684586 n=1 Tax=Mytilus trossulus TaxID=6551 RepID=UPI003005C317
MIIDRCLPYQKLQKYQVEKLYKLEKTSSELYVTLGAGFCYQGDYKSCLIFINVLENAMLAIPKIRTGYRVEWPNTNKKKFLDEYLLEEKQKSVGKEVTKKEREEIIEKMCSLLGLPEKLLTTKGPCKRPDLMTKTQLNNELQSRGLSLDGSLEQRQSTLEKDDKKCKYLTLPDIRNKRLRDLLYYSVSPTCLRLDACFSPTITIGRKTIKKSFKAFVNVDNCHFIVTLGFEGWRKSLILISYDWGKKEELHITDEIKVMFSISRNEDKNQFSVNLGMKLSIQGSVLIDEMFIQDMHVPIPFCDSSFKLPGDGSLKGLVESLGNKMTSEGFKLVLKQFGLDKILPSSPCTVPDFTADCPLAIDPKKYLPSNLHGIVRCNMTNDCFGLHCCLDLKFTVRVDIIELSVPMLFKMDSCNFEVEAKFGTFKYKSSILNYDWGNEQSLKIGSGEPAPIIIRYSVNKDYNNDIIVNVQITICFNIGEETFCIPENGFYLLNNQIIPSCSRNFTDITKFSVSNWMKETSVGLHDGMKEAAVHYVLEKLDIQHLFEGPMCDRKRKPYIPSVQGWHNECKFGVFRLPDVENMMSCHITEFCTGIKCCGVIPIFGLTLEPFLIIDPCEYVIFYGINTINKSLSLFDYEWGKKIQLSLANNVIKIEFSIRKPPGQKMYIIDLSIMACLIDGEKCVPDIKILDSTQFRQIVCDLDVTFNLKNFSLNNWIHQIGSSDESGKLSTSQVRLLLQQLGLDKYISSPGCKRTDSKYLPAVKGWKSDCTYLSSSGLVELPKYLSCSVSASCTAVDCCMDLNLLNLTLNFHISVDTCEFIIKGAIEKFDFELPFSNYVYGDVREVRLREVIRIM